MSNSVWAMSHSELGAEIKFVPELLVGNPFEVLGPEVANLKVEHHSLPLTPLLVCN